jgi:tetratricopeptide (TPR) repeat protein
MKEDMQKPSEAKKSDWLDTVEIVSVVGSIGGSIASVFLNQAAVACIPLSMTMTLNLMNRRRMLEAMSQSQEAHSSAIAQIVKANAAAATKLESFAQQIGQGQKEVAALKQDKLEIETQLNLQGEQLNQLQQSAADLSQGQDRDRAEIDRLSAEQMATQTQIEMLGAQMSEVQQLTADLSKATEDLQQYTQSLQQEKTEIAEQVVKLQSLETCTQSIRIDPNNPSVFYQRALNYQKLEGMSDKQAAIADFSAAIKIDPSYAEAHRDRGILYLELGSKREALKDLRQAANLFFEKGDIPNYETARELAKQVHEVSLPTPAYEDVPVLPSAVDTLFA